MRPQDHPGHDQALARLAHRQHGVVSLRQLDDLGFSRTAVRRRVEVGRLHRLHRGVFAVGHRRLTLRARWLAAVLACGPAAVLSHGAALALWDLRPQPAGAIDVTVVARGRRGLPGVRLHCVRALNPDDRLTREAIPVTTVARTLLDYAEIAPADQLRTALDAADRRELLDTRELEHLLDRSPGRRGAQALTRALTQLTGPAPWTRSEFERQFLALVRAAGLPEPQCNVVVAGVEVDFFWPAARVAVETDGYGFHGGRSQFETDRARDARLAVAGIRTVRLTQRRLHNDRREVEAQLHQLLQDLL
jgi:very-short-patch-repair endonuclease/predicted transcriptional regulator of viral defense system